MQRNGGGASFVARGQERYTIYCAPCHGDTGSAEGPVANRVARLNFNAMVPPTFHDERLRGIPDGQLFATISHGIRNMPAYAQSIPTDDRWAIVSYVRALQLSEQGRPSRRPPPRPCPRRTGCRRSGTLGCRCRGRGC